MTIQWWPFARDALDIMMGTSQQLNLLQPEVVLVLPELVLPEVPQLVPLLPPLLPQMLQLPSPHPLLLLSLKIVVKK